MSELNDLLTTRELQRWRLILGEAAETTLCGLDDNARQIDHALEWLYGRDPERLQRGERYGGLGTKTLYPVFRTSASRCRQAAARPLLPATPFALSLTRSPLPRQRRSCGLFPRTRF